MNKRIKVFFLVFLIVILGCFTNVFATNNSDAIEIGTSNLNGTAVNSAKVGNQLFHPEVGWARYDDTNPKMLFKGSFNDYPSNVYYNGSTKYGIGTALIKFYGSKFRILMSYNPDRSNSNFVTVDGTKIGQFDQIKGSLIPQALGFQENNLTEGVHVVQIDLGNNSTLDAFDIDDSGYLIQLDKNLTLNKTSETLTVGQTDTLSQVVVPDNAPDKSLTWTSSDPSIANVDTFGKVTAVKAGSAIITATTNDGSNLTSSCAVNVKDSNTTISLNKTTDNLTVGANDTLTATITPTDAVDKNVTWTSSDPSIATVDASGKITAVKPGTVTVTATTDNGKTASCNVTVENNTVNLTIFMQDSTTRQYTITKDEFTKFTNWYNLRANGGTFSDSYTFNLPVDASSS
ncbi:Ig-like domain-containing protein, partial [Clostridium acetobutylicum]